MTLRYSLLKQLDLLANALSATVVLHQILDDEWLSSMRRNIESQPQTGPFNNEAVSLFFEFHHVLRGDQRFEAVQAKLVAGEKVGALDDDLLFGLGLLGLDPILDWLPELDERLAALVQLRDKQPNIRDKIAQLRTCRETLPFRNHLFEALVLGFFAEHGVLIDVEPTRAGVDGSIELHGREILVEVTYTAQELISAENGVQVGGMAPLVEQVLKKVQKKVTSGRQIARVEAEPALLVLGLNPRGAGSVEAQMALHKIFSDQAYGKMSGMILAYGWKFRAATFFVNPNAEVGFSDAEVASLREWFRFPVPPVLAPEWPSNSALQQ